MLQGVHRKQRNTVGIPADAALEDSRFTVCVCELSAASPTLTWQYAAKYIPAAPAYRHAPVSLKNSCSGSLMQWSLQRHVAARLVLQWINFRSIFVGSFQEGKQRGMEIDIAGLIYSNIMSLWSLCRKLRRHACKAQRMLRSKQMLRWHGSSLDDKHWSFA